MSQKPSQLIHRERLVEAMTEVAAEHGYVDTTVADVVKHAGVSRATFYEHFADKEDCFIAAHREIAKQVADELRPFIDGAGTSVDLAAMLAQLLELVARRPAASRLLLIEALAAGAQVRAEREQLMEDVEQVAIRLLEHEDGRTIDIPSWALLGGLTHILTTRLRTGRQGELPGLFDELVVWIGSYALPEGSARHDRMYWKKLGQSYPPPDHDSHRRVAEDELEPRRLPRGRHHLPENVIHREHQERIVAATAELAHAKGYVAMTVGDIVTTAGISRNVFYAHFGSKREAFAAAQAVALRDSMVATSAAFLASLPWPERVWNAARAFMEYAASVPNITHLHIVESYAAGPSAIERLSDTQTAFTVFLNDGYREKPRGEQLPRLCSEAIAGASLEMLYRQVNAGRTAILAAFLPELAYTALAPFLGPARALELINEQLGATGETQAHHDREIVRSR